MKSLSTGRIASTAAALLVIGFLVQGIWFIRNNSQTSDEAVHLAAGYSYLKATDFRLNPEHPPLPKMLAGLAVLVRHGVPFQPNPRYWAAAEQWGIGLDFLYRSPVDHRKILETGRLPNLLLGAILVALVGWWAHRLWGAKAALVATALAAFEPNLLAHSCLITTDLAATLFTFLALYLLWEYVQSPRWWNLVSLGAATGLALVSKFSAIQLPVLLAASIGALALSGEAVPLPGGPGHGAARGSAGGIPRLAKAAAPLAILLGIAVLLIPSAYLFHGYGAWWIGLSRVLSHQELGHDAFFLGEYSDQGWLLYFPVAFLIKTPVATLILIAASLLLFRTGTWFRTRDAACLLLPVALIFAAASRGKINIGLRHVLPVYPFLLVAASRVATIRFRGGISAFAGVGVLAGLSAASSLASSPHQLAYFSGLVGGPAEGYRYLSDSNLDWGQDLTGLAEYLKREKVPMVYLSYFGNAPPGAYGIRYQYLPSFGHLEPPPPDLMPADAPRELLAISVSSLQGVLLRDRTLYWWLYARKPLARIGYSIFVYDVTGDPEAHLHLAEVYLKTGRRVAAGAELRKVLARVPDHAEAGRLLGALEGGS